MIEFDTPTRADVDYLAKNLREEDKREVDTVMPGAEIHKVLKESVDTANKCFIVRKDDVPAVVFGSSETPDFLGLGAKAADIWLLGTDEIKLNKTSFLKLSRKVIREIADEVDYLWNIVDPRNELHIRWLQWLGFSFPTTYETKGGVDFLVAVRYS